MNHDVTVSTTLCCRVLTLVCCQPVHGRSGWHLVAQHITWHVVVYVLALGCPTLQSGISLPNTPIWHAVAQHLDMVLGRHMGAQHVFRSTCLYISFDLAGRASYRLWYSVTSTVYTTSFVIRWLHVLPYGHFILRLHAPAELCICLIHVIHYIPCSGTLLLFVPEFIGTPVDPDFSMFHSTFTSSLHYLSAPDVMSWHYRITCYSSSQQLMILLVSIHRYVEPFVISWLYGTPDYVMISVMMTLCIILTSELLYLRTCTVIIRCALRGTLLRCPVVHVLLWSAVPVFRYVLFVWWCLCRESWPTSSCIVATLVLHSWSP